MENIEIWKDIEWYEGLYQISNLWNIKSLWKYCNSKNWSKQFRKERFKILQDNWFWYKHTILCKNWKAKNFLIHRLVWEHFLEKNLEKKEINHKDWNKNNNSFSNLEWCTHAENMTHRFNVLWKNKLKTNHHCLGIFWKDHPSSKRVNQFSKTWFLIKTWDSMKDVERTIWIKHNRISQVCNGKRKSTWGFIWSFAN